MARSKTRILDTIEDDLDPKGATVAWYDPVTEITYGDEDGKTPAEPYAFMPVPNDDGEWVMKEIWTTEANYNKHLKAIFDRLAGADAGGSLMVLEKSEVDGFKARIKELEGELREAKSSGGTAKKSTGKKASAPGGTRHIRIWLRENGHNMTIAGPGRIPVADVKLYEAEFPDDDFKPSPEQIDRWNAWIAEQDGQEPLPMDGDEDEENAHESETLDAALEASEAPAFTGGDDTIRKATNHLRKAKGEAAMKASVPLTDDVKEAAVSWFASEGGTAWLNENNLVAA